MKILKQVKLKDNEKDSLRELTSKLREKFPETDVVLYGSKARGDDGRFSDIDILVLLDRTINNTLEEEVFSIAFKVELKYDVIFGIVVYSKMFWDSGLGKSMPLRINIDREGILIKNTLGNRV